MTRPPGVARDGGTVTFWTIVSGSTRLLRSTYARVASLYFISAAVWALYLVNGRIERVTCVGGVLAGVVLGSLNARLHSRSGAKRSGEYTFLTNPANITVTAVVYFVLAMAECLLSAR